MRTERQYEQLYSKLLTYAERLHQANKRRIRRGLIWLLLLPLLLGLILIVTGADKIVFLIIWILCMFALCAYLITVEYVDDAIQKAINDVSETEEQFDALLPQPEPLRVQLEPLRAAITERFGAKAASGAEGGAGSEDKKEAPDT